MRNYALHQAQQSDSLSVTGVVGRLVHNWKARRELAQLSRFDDHMLRDIGLTRVALISAMNTSLSDDPYAKIAPDGRLTRR